MGTDRFVEVLLKKYRMAPSFPFLNWATDTVSFYALMNLWDDLFQAASGQLIGEFHATIDAKMDPDSPIYDVTSNTLSKRVLISPEADGGTFHFIPRDGETGQRFRSELGFATDIAPERLISAFEIIRAYLAYDVQSRAELAALDAQCVERFEMHFGFSDYDPFESRRGKIQGG